MDKLASSSHSDQALLERPKNEGNASNKDDKSIDTVGKTKDLLVAYRSNQFDNYQFTFDNVPSTNPKIQKEKLQAEIEIFGEPFLLEEDDNLIHISHKKWSLSGSGKTTANAYKNLKENGSILLNAYGDIRDEELTKDAKEMTQFLRITFGDG